MKKKIEQVRLVVGDSNEVTNDELLVVKSNTPGIIHDVMKRDNSGNLKSIIVPKKEDETDEEVLYRLIHTCYPDGKIEEKYDENCDTTRAYRAILKAADDAENVNKVITLPGHLIPFAFDARSESGHTSRYWCIFVDSKSIPYEVTIYSHLYNGFFMKVLE